METIVSQDRSAQERRDHRVGGDEGAGTLPDAAHD
jgi:hypothetical protein